MSLKYPKSVTSIDYACEIIKFFKIPVEEYTDCTIVYRATFDQLRAMYDLGRDHAGNNEAELSRLRDNVEKFKRYTKEEAVKAAVSQGENDHLRDLVREMRDALNAANRFIVNGIDLGFIRMPDADCPDPAHETPKIVRDAIAKADAILKESNA